MPDHARRIFGSITAAADMGIESINKQRGARAAVFGCFGALASGVGVWRHAKGEWHELS